MHEIGSENKSTDWMNYALSLNKHWKCKYYRTRSGLGRGSRTVMPNLINFEHVQKGQGKDPVQGKLELWLGCWGGVWSWSCTEGLGPGPFTDVSGLGSSQGPLWTE